MIVFVIYALDVFPDKTKRDAPIAAHFDAPGASSHTLQFMQVQSRQVHVARDSSGIEPAENQPQPVSMRCLDSPLAAPGEKVFEALVSKPFDRHWLECNLSGYEFQSAFLPVFLHGPMGPT